MNDQVNHASQLNSYGVALLASGDRLNAVRAFRSALETLDNAASSYHTENVVLRRVSSDKTLASEPSTIRSQDPTLSTLITFPQLNFVSHGEKTTRADEGQFFMYTNPFHFDALATLSSSFEADIAFYSSVILFNMALAFHLKENRMNTRSQRKALSIYNAGTNIIGDLLKENLDQQKKQDVNDLLVAFLNNKAHIYYELSDFVMLRNQLGYMKEKLSPQDQFLYDRQHMQGFLINLMLLSTTFVARAA